MGKYCYSFTMNLSTENVQLIEKNSSYDKKYAKIETIKFCRKKININVIKCKKYQYKYFFLHE